MRYIKFLLTSTILILIITLLLQSCSSTNSTKKEKSSISFNEIKEEFNVSDEFSTAVFSGGCFWCVEKDFEKLEGVIEAISGYTSNSSQDEAPTYEQVASGSTNFRESVLVIYDSTKLNFKELVEYFLIHHDPTDEGGSFYDRGFQYTSAIYYQNSNQKDVAISVISTFQEEGIYEEPIITSVEELTNFFMAEEYHQDYYKKNSLQYRAYRFASGRDKHISSIKSKIN